MAEAMSQELHRRHETDTPPKKKRRKATREEKYETRKCLLQALLIILVVVGIVYLGFHLGLAVLGLGLWVIGRFTGAG